MRPWGTQGIAGFQLCGRTGSTPCRTWCGELSRDQGCTPSSSGTHSALSGTLLHALSESFQCLGELRLGATLGLSPSVARITDLEIPPTGQVKGLKRVGALISHPTCGTGSVAP